VPLASDARQVAATLSVAGLAVLLIAAAGRYRRRLNLSVLDELPAIVGRLVVATAVIAGAIALRGDPDAVTIFVQNCAMAVVLVVGGRVVTTRLINWSRESGRAMHRTVVVGGGDLAAELIDLLDGDRRYGLAVVGFVEVDRDRAAADIVPWLGPVSNLDRAVRDSGADTVLVVGADGPECGLVKALRGPGCLGCDVFVVPRLYHLHLDPAPVDRIGSVPVVRIRRPNLAGPARATRRVVDVAIAGLAVALLSPIIAVRAMTRRTTPNLWPVLRGERSSVGPRAEPLEHADGFWSRYECYGLRTRARAGLTGLAQVNGVHGNSAHERAGYDNHYIETWSPWLDIKIVIAALCQLVAGREP
jgi:lipopolysaccharide/colanic/teichoic acid biosynthesis glycosyltransferase